MLKVKLGKAFAFLPQTNIDPIQALFELMGDIDPTQLNVSEEILQGLSGEWILFDYKPKNGKTLVEQYYFSNPDDLNKTELRELKQIIESQSLHLLQTYAGSQPPYVFLQSVFTDKKFKVFDRAMSQSIGNLPGSFFGRIAKIGKIYYLVGSNPIIFPIRHTQRAIKIFAKEKTPPPTLREIIQQLLEPKKIFKKTISIKSEREKLKKRYEQISKKSKSKVTFKAIVDFVYEENYQHHFADYITDLMKLGIPEELCIEHLDLFQEIWNYFPHKILGNKCPHELYEKELESSN